MNKKDLKYSLVSITNLLNKNKWIIADNIYKEALASDNPAETIVKYVIAFEEFREEFLEKYL